MTKYPSWFNKLYEDHTPEEKHVLWDALVDEYPEPVETKPSNPNEMRTFDTGATRHVDEDKLDYEGFLSPVVLERYAQYLHEHRIQADGKLRDSDNWCRGIPKTVYMKSLWRHFVDVWKHHRGYSIEGSFEDALCAVMFNAMGMLFEELHGNKEQSSFRRSTEKVQSKLEGQKD